MNEVIRINEHDNVVTALRPLSKGEIIKTNGINVKLRDNIPFGHKIAVYSITADGPVIKYGFPIGKATRNIVSGEHVHSHNLSSLLAGTKEYTYSPNFRDFPKEPSRSFLGYERKDGRVGTRNEVWIIPTVGCVNQIAKNLEKATSELDYSGIDTVSAFTHPYGCSQLGDDLYATQCALCGLIRHPNAGGVLVLGLGCENNRIEEIKKVLGDYDSERVRFLQCQDCSDEMEEGIEILRSLIAYTSKFSRTPVPVSKLIIGHKCGGSDAFSGITANPLLGRFAEKLCSQGGSVILTEVPEMFGAEHVLMQRCRDKSVFDKTVGLINNFKNYFLSYGEKVSENPSLGNKDGGITTLEEKSLGCIQKGGHVVVEDVLTYAEQIKKQGLSLLQATGNDLVSSSALAVSGAQIILFTTGRGTPLGSPVPTVKVSTQNELSDRKNNWIDFNAGPLIDGEDMEVLSDRFFDYVLKVASGEELTRSEISGSKDFAIFKRGVTL